MEFTLKVAEAIIKSKVSKVQTTELDTEAAVREAIVEVVEQWLLQVEEGCYTCGRVNADVHTELGNIAGALERKAEPVVGR